MTNKISLFSGMNTNNDLLPADLAKDLYQTITALETKYSSANDSTSEYIDLLEKHIINYHNPHKLKSVIDIKNSLVNTIYDYYKTYYNTDDDNNILSQSALFDLANKDILPLLELLRRIQLNGFRWIDGYSFSNLSNDLLKNYFTNGVEIDVLKESDTPIYHSSECISSREFPYLEDLYKYQGTETTINFNKLKDYYIYQQDSDYVDSSYGLSYDQKTMLLLGWDENLGSNNTDAKGVWTLIVDPSKTVIFIRSSFDSGVYNIICNIGTFDGDTFDITIDYNNSHVFRTDIPKCAVTFGVNNICSISSIVDGKLTRQDVNYHNTNGNIYTVGKVYSSAVTDTTLFPNSIIDPDITGKPATSFTPDKILHSGMTVLETSKLTVPNSDGYSPNDYYLIERLGQD